jgi:predicted lactoylglutathione lyase
MQAKAIFINLPVKDIKSTRAFWTKLGFSFYEQFSGKESLCLILNENHIFCMFLTEHLFGTYTHKPIPDRKFSQAILAIQVETREEVCQLVSSALENGAKRYKEPVDQGWMYYDSFEDPDGYQWEVMFSDVSKYPV